MIEFAHLLQSQIDNSPMVLFKWYGDLIRNRYTQLFNRHGAHIEAEPTHR